MTNLNNAKADWRPLQKLQL